MGEGPTLVKLTSSSWKMEGTIMDGKRNTISKCINYLYLTTHFPTFNFQDFTFSYKIPRNHQCCNEMMHWDACTLQTTIQDFTTLYQNS